MHLFFCEYELFAKGKKYIRCFGGHGAVEDQGYFWNAPLLLQFNEIVQDLLRAAYGKRRNQHAAFAEFRFTSSASTSSGARESWVLSP